MKREVRRRGTAGPCHIWPSSDEVSALSLHEARTSSSWNYSPRAGGVFQLDDFAVTTHLSEASNHLRIKISRWIYDQNNLGIVGFLTGEEIDRIANQPSMRIDVRMARLLECFSSLASQVFMGLWVSGTQIEGGSECLNLIQAATECANRAG